MSQRHSAEGHGPGTWGKLAASIVVSSHSFGGRRLRPALSLHSGQRRKKPGRSGRVPDGGGTAGYRLGG